jgi:hypothetical protein
LCFLSFADDDDDDQTAIYLTTKITILQDQKVHYCVDKANITATDIVPSQVTNRATY